MVFHRLAALQEAAKHDDDFELPSWARAFDSMATAASDFGEALEDIWIVSPHCPGPHC